MTARTLIALCLVGVASIASAEVIVFPDDPRAVIDVKRDCGAVGDGVADDTAALQAAIERAGGNDYTRFIYLPIGTYRITQPVVFKRPGDGAKQESMVGPWLYGQDREKTIIRLSDGADGFGDAKKPKELIRGVGRPDGAKMNADFFDRTVRNLTIDAGDNRGAIGLRFYSNNTGLLKDVTLRADLGAIGLDLGWLDQNGPLLVQDVDIKGFDVGVSTGHILNSQTLSRVTIHAEQTGLLHRGQVLAGEGLNITALQAIDSGGNGVLVVVDSHLKAPPALDLNGPSAAAIKVDKAHAYFAGVKTAGYPQAIVSTSPAGNREQAEEKQYLSHGILTLGDGSPNRGLRLAAPPEPTLPWPTKPEDWVCANDFGAKAGDEADDAPAIQQAIDEAAKRGATTVYILGGKSGDPNWYHLKQNVRIHGSVNRVMGMGFVRLLGGETADAAYPENLARFIIEDQSNAPPVVMLEHLQVFAPHLSFGIEVRANKRTVVLQTLGGTPIVRPGATVFMTNCVGHLYLEKGSTVWARQYNTEGGPKAVGVNTRNAGGQLWILGMKTEATSTKIATTDGGQTEVLGVHNYNTSGDKTGVPFFDVTDATMSVAGYREVHFGGNWWKTPVRGTWKGVESTQAGAKWQTWSLLRAGADGSE